MKKIGILTRDCAGMNACIRAVVRTADHRNVEIYGIFRGYDGLMDNEVKLLNRRSVSNIIGTGGTILKTARALRFKTEQGQALALETIKKNNFDGLIIAGGNGTLTGAHLLATKYNIPVIGIPATIDNDINGVELSLGADTAVNVAIDAIDKIRDTATSLERIFVVEVMGRDCGYLALQTALACGCEEVLLPEKNDFCCSTMCEQILDGHKKGKVSWIIVVAEGKAKASDIADCIREKTNLETREVVLGHVQRGGRPTAVDRILAARFGSYALDCLIQGMKNKCVCVNDKKLTTIDLAEAIKPKPLDYSETYRLIKILT